MWKYSDSTKQSVCRSFGISGIEYKLIGDIADWLAEGNIPDQWRTPTEALDTTITEKNAERSTEYSRRVTLAQGTDDPLQLQLANSKQQKALRKESKGTQSQADTDYLDARDVLDDALDVLGSKNDALELLIEGSTQAELDVLDVTNDIHWA